MLKHLFIAVTAAGALVASGAAAHEGHAGQAAPLPDFPSYARPGECWARVPAGPAAQAGPPGQSVWTLEKGTGPGAVWSYSQRPAPGATAHADDLNWARVDCAGRRPFGMAQTAPPPLPPVPPMAYSNPTPPMDDFAAPPPPPMRGPMHGGPAGPMRDLGPYADGQAALAPNPYGPGLEMAPPSVFDQPPPAPRFAPRPVAPRWFGDRMLTWAGKGR